MTHAERDTRRAELVTVKEFAYITRQHEHSVYRRIRERRQPGLLRVGRSWRIDLAYARVSNQGGGL